jgi:hypothetical protein
MMKESGEILDYSFEKVKLKIGGDICWYTPDFMVINSENEIEFHEVKGHKRVFIDDAKVKIKAAAMNYPFKFIVAFPIAKKLGGGWEIQEVKAH